MDDGALDYDQSELCCACGIGTRREQASRRREDEQAAPPLFLPSPFSPTPRPPKTSSLKTSLHAPTSVLPCLRLLITTHQPARAPVDPTATGRAGPTEHQRSRHRKQARPRTDERAATSSRERRSADPPHQTRLHHGAHDFEAPVEADREEGDAHPDGEVLPRAPRRRAFDGFGFRFAREVGGGGKTKPTVARASSRAPALTRMHPPAHRAHPSHAPQVGLDAAGKTTILYKLKLGGELAAGFLHEGGGGEGGGLPTDRPTDRRRPCCPSLLLLPLLLLLLAPDTDRRSQPPPSTHTHTHTHTRARAQRS
jgi:hypothetical protein